MRRLRVGVIGLGVGERHLETYLDHAECEVVSICDADARRLAEVGARHPGPRRLRDAHAVLDDPAIELVSIATYDSQHFEQARHALGAGKHAFVEKPLCTTAGEIGELRRLLAAQAGLRLSCNLPLRVLPRFSRLRAQLRAGALGRLYYAELDYNFGRLWKLTEGWRGREPAYSVMLGGGVHMVDLLLWLTGRRVRRVSAAVGNRLASAGSAVDVDDLVVALLELDDGALAKVSANFGCVHPHFHDVRLFCTEATWLNGVPDAILWSGERTAPRAQPDRSPYQGVPRDEGLRSFVAAILHDEPPVVGEDEVFATMDVLFAIERARRTGRAQELG